MSSGLQVISHRACGHHDPGSGHPESPTRLLTLLHRLEHEGIAVSEAVPATPDELAVVHDRDYLTRLAATANRKRTPFDADTVACSRSWDAIRGAAGAVLAAARVASTGGRAFAAVRPPGHHALADRAMGFCFVAHAVLCARNLLARGTARVLIVDWDVHHGNGTQSLVEADPRIRFVSLHQWPAYPGTGRADERGCGNLWNLPPGPGLGPVSGNALARDPHPPPAGPVALGGHREPPRGRVSPGPACRCGHDPPGGARCLRGAAVYFGIRCASATPSP